MPTFDDDPAFFYSSTTADQEREAFLKRQRERAQPLDQEPAARQRHQKGNGRTEPGGAAGDDEGPPPEFEIHDVGDIDEEPIEPRQWVFGTRYCIGFVSGTLGDGGVGKTALALVDAVSISTGRSLTGEHLFRRENVLIVCLEDDLKEIKRRIKAVMLHHGIDPSEVKGRLFYCVHKGEKLIVQSTIRNSTTPGRLGGMIRAAVQKYAIKAVIIDPLVKAHAVDENSNVAMDTVIDELVAIASDEDTAIMVSHHTRKGSSEPGNADIGRGATAVKNGARLVYTAVKMTEAERAKFALNEIDAAALFRVDSGKVNICPAALAKWFRLVGVKLGNTSELYPHGDEVQTVEPWTPPDLFAGLSAATLNLILDKIDKGLPDGTRYSHSGAAKSRAAWLVVIEFTSSKNEKQAREIINTWVRNEVLISRDYDDPERRETVKGLFVNPAKRPGNEHRF
jgi:hypothetical protein